MKRSLNKSIFAILAVAVLLPAICSCSFFKKNKILTAAAEFGDVLRSGDASEIIKKTDGLDREYKKTVKSYLDVNDYSEEECTYLAHMMSSIVINIDAGSVKVSKDTASVDMSFTIADHYALDGGDYADINALADAVDNGKTRTIDITVEFIESEKEWYVTNFDDDGFQDLFSFFTTPMPAIGKGALIETAKKIADSVIKDDPSIAVNNAASVSSTDMIDLPSYLTGLFDLNSELTDEDKAFRAAVISTMTYEVDESTLKIDSRTGSIDIRITMADYETLAGSEFKKIDDIAPAILACPSKTYKFTCEFARNNAVWYATNLESEEYAAFLKYKDFKVSMKTIDGTYIAVVDITDNFKAYITKEFNVSIPADVEGRIYISSTLVLNKGQYEVTIDRDALVEDIRNFVETNIDKIIMNTLGTTSSIALDTMAKLAGYADYADMRQQILSQVTGSLDTIDTSGMESSGTFTFNDNLVTLKSPADTLTGTIDNFGVITVTAPVNDPDARKLLGSDTIALPYKKV